MPTLEESRAKFAATDAKMRAYDACQKETQWAADAVEALWQEHLDEHGAEPEHLALTQDVVDAIERRVAAIFECSVKPGSLGPYRSPFGTLIPIQTEETPDAREAHLRNVPVLESRRCGR